nr:hypothetical protein [Tanacetum cinerariifolium]
MESYYKCSQQMSHGKRLKLGTVRLPILQILWGIIHSTNLDFASLIWDEFEWKIVERLSRPSKMSKLLYTRFTKLIIDYLLSLNKIPYAMNSDAIKKKAGYKYYMAKKVKIKIAKIINKLEEQHVSPVKSGRGKGFMCYGDQVANVPNKLKKDDVPWKTRSLTITKEVVVVEDPAVQSLLDLQKGSKVSRLKSLRQKKQPVAGEGSSAAQNKYYSSMDIDNDATLYSSSLDESANEIDDADESDMDLSDDNSHGDDDDARYGVFMHNKSTATPNSTYLNLMVTCSSLYFIQTLLDETHANELMDFMSRPVYTDAHTTLMVHNPEGNPELTSYISANTIPYRTTTPQPSSLQAKAKKQMQKAKKNMRMFNFKKAVTQKFKEHGQMLEDLTNFNISEAFEKVVQAKVLAGIKKLLPTHISNAILNYVKPDLNTSVLEVMKTNQINLFTQSSTSIDDLLK